jgi:hypothetical protein
LTWAAESGAHPLGVTRERVRQLETDALGKLALAAIDSRYAPLRWRSVARPVRNDRVHAIKEVPPWMEQLLGWLADKPT